MSNPIPEEKKNPVKADVTIWQPGKTIQEMLDYEYAITGGLMRALTVLSKLKPEFNIGSIWTELKKQGFEVEHGVIKLLLESKLGINQQLDGFNLYKAIPSHRWVAEELVVEGPKSTPVAPGTKPAVAKPKPVIAVDPASV